MFKFKGNKNQQSNTEIAKSVEDFFAFSKIATLGFPYKPTAFAWDPDLCLMAIGTRFGALRIFGASAVQFCGELRQRICIANVVFIPKKARLISLCTDNSLHLWELNERDAIWCLEEVKSFVLSGLMKKITSISLSPAHDILYLGTMCGNIYTLNVESFEIAESVIYQDVVVQNIPDDKKLKQGAVKVMSSQPGCPDCLLIGYQQGLLALWDVKKLVVINTFISNQSLESVAWQHHGMKFMSSHGDGSYMTWNTDDSSKPAEVPMTPYGPFACKAIEKIVWKSVKGGDDFIIFSGGMPRSSYGEKYTVTIMCGDQHEVLDLSSKVIDFFTISEVSNESEFDNPSALMILLEEELIAIDLESDSWLPFKYPYLEIPHSSSITCYQYVSDVHKDMWRMLTNLKANTTETSESAWPVKGGQVISGNNKVNDILVTGHEDGTLKIWSSAPTSLQLLYTFQPSQVFVCYESEEGKDDITEEWPPFRKVRQFDCLLDDPRFAIRSIVLHDVAKTLVAAGAAGQILVLQLLDIEAEKETIVSHVTIGDKWDSNLWCNPQPLIVKHGKRKYSKGFHVQCVVQLTPPAPVTSLAFHTEWNLIAAGITHGFLLYDIVQKKSVLSRYTLNISDNSTIIGSVSPKTKSLRRSFRESFRKLKLSKSKSSKKESTGSLSSDRQEEVSLSSSKRESFTSSPDPTLGSSTSPELHSFEGDLESRNTEVINSVQCLYFAQTFIINNVITTPTLWVGTSNGGIYIYTITLPANDCRTSDAVTCQLGKEVQLKHQAPVMAIQIVDHRGYPLPDPTDVQCQRCKPADLCGSHRVVISTEEQIKVFTLPSMKPYCKNKITITEGYHISKVGFSTFPNKTDPKSSEHCVLCLSRSSGISLYSIPELKKIISYNYCPIEDMTFLPKLLFLNTGLIVTLNSASEFEIISLSAAITSKPVCSIVLPEGARDATTKPSANIVLEMQDCAVQNGGDSVDGHSSHSDPRIQNEFSNSEINVVETRRTSASSIRRSVDHSEENTDDLGSRNADSLTTNPLSTAESTRYQLIKIRRLTAKNGQETNLPGSPDAINKRLERDQCVNNAKRISTFLELYS